MTGLTINIKAQGDISYDASYTIGAASNFSDGVDRGYRPAVNWAMVRHPNIIIASGMFNIKDEDALETESAAIARALALMFDEDCICSWVINAVLEEYEREA